MTKGVGERVFLLARYFWERMVQDAGISRGFRKEAGLCARELGPITAP